MPKKRINIYVDEDIYREFKRACAISGETITAVIDEAMKQYTDSIDMILQAGDKDSLMAMLQKRLDIQMTNIEKDIDTRLKAKK